jgi:hypothetical protein
VSARRVVAVGIKGAGVREATEVDAAVGTLAVCCTITPLALCVFVAATCSVCGGPMAGALAFGIGVTVGRGVLGVGILLDVDMGGVDITISIVQRSQAVRRSGRNKNNTTGGAISCKSLVLILIMFLQDEGIMAIIQEFVLRHPPGNLTTLSGDATNL